MKRSLTAVTLLLLLVSLLLTGCSAGSKTFTVDDMSITLGGLFWETDPQQSMAVFRSLFEVVIINKLSFDSDLPKELSSDSSLSDCAEYVRDSIEPNAELFTEDGVTYFIYQNSKDDQTFTYLVSIHKSDTHIWFIQFSSVRQELADVQDTFLSYAKTVTFAE